MSFLVEPPTPVLSATVNVSASQNDSIMSVSASLTTEQGTKMPRLSSLNFSCETFKLNLWGCYTLIKDKINTNFI